MEKVRPRCGRPSDRGRLKNRTEHGLVYSETESEAKASSWKTQTSRLYHLRLQQPSSPAAASRPVPHPAVVARPTAAAAAAGGREELRESGAELVAEEAVDERVPGSMSAHDCQRSSAEDRAPTSHGHHGHTTPRHNTPPQARRTPTPQPDYDHTTLHIQMQCGVTPREK